MLLFRVERRIVRFLSSGHAAINLHCKTTFAMICQNSFLTDLFLVA